MHITPNSLPQNLICDSGGMTAENLMTLQHGMLSAKTDVETENNIMVISDIL
jgi:hypothetical protein